MPEPVVIPEATPVVETPPKPDEVPPVETPLEGDPSDKLTPDHPRFKEVYAKLKEAERKNETLERDFKVAGDHNQELSNAINNLNTNLVDARTADSSKVLDDKIATLEREFSATIAEDPTKAQEIANQLVALRVDQGVDQRMAEVKAQPLEPEPSSVGDIRNVGYKEAMYDLVLADNLWLLENKQAQVMATSIDDQLSRDPEWTNKPDLARIREAVKRTQEMITPKNTGTLTEGAGDITPAVNLEAMTLTDVERGVSHKLLPKLSPAEAEARFLHNKKEIAKGAGQEALRK